MEIRSILVQRSSRVSKQNSHNDDIYMGIISQFIRRYSSICSPSYIVSR